MSETTCNEASSARPCYVAFSDTAEAQRMRPESLTIEKAESVLPILETCPEWQRKRDAGELPDGLLGLQGSLKTVWPAARLTHDEAVWILRLRETGSMRWLAGIVVDDDNQIHGMHLIEAAERDIAT